MTGDTELRFLLRSLSPRLNEGRYVYTQIHREIPVGANPIVVVRESEGLSLIVRQEEADALDLSYAFVAAWITFDVHSALEAIGLTAVISATLSDAGLSANVVAGYTHDHVFVQHDTADRAMHALRSLGR